MRKNIKLSLIVVLVLILVCTIVVIWNPAQRAKNDAASTSTTISQAAESSVVESGNSETSEVSGAIESSSFLESSLISESSLIPESSLNNSSAVIENTNSIAVEVSDLVPEDQPDTPNLNFETSGSSYDDIMINVLTCLLSQDMTALSDYVGSNGLRLSPTGIATGSDVILSSADLIGFFSLGSQSYGTYPGSGESIVLSPTEYYEKYIVPSGFDFSTAVVAYNDTYDLTAVAGYVSDPKTVSYEYAPNVMEWQRLIMVYESTATGDVLCGIIYQDATTN